MERLEFRDLELEAFVHATESAERVERAVRTLAPTAAIERKSMGGHFGQELTALRGRVSDRTQIRAVLERVRAAVGHDVARTAAKRIDRDLVLHMRFDKQAAARGDIALDAGAPGDVVKMRVRLRAPRLDQPAAIALVQSEFGGLREGEEE